MQNSENNKEPFEQANARSLSEKISGHKKSEASVPTGKRAYKETIRLFIKMLVTIFLCEAAIMALLYIMPPKRGWEIVLDPLLLTILGTPILYWLLIRPIWLALEQRNRAVEILRESENRLKEAQHIGQVGDWELDVKTQEITWSEEVYRLFDRDPAQGPPTIEENMAYYYPEDSKRLQEQVSKAIELGEEFDADYQVKLPGGKTVYQHGLIRTVKDENGKVIKLYGTVQDITERKKAEESQQESESRYKAVVDNAAEGIAVGQDGMVKFANPHLIAIMGFSEKELMSQPFIEFIHPDHREQVMDIHLRRFKGKQVPETYEFKFIDKGGNTKWAENNGVLIEWDGRPATLNFLRDITERKRAEELLRQSTNLLRESQEVARLGHYVFDALTGSWESSDILDSIFGIGGDYPRSIDSWLQIVHREQRDEMSAYFSEVVLGQGQPFDREYRIKHVSDQQVKWVHGLGRLEFDKEGKPIRMIGTIQDITDRKKAEEALRLSEDKFSKAFHSSPDSIAITSFDNGRLLEINEGFQEMFGYSRNETLGKTTVDLNLWQSSEERNAMLKEFEDKGRVRDLEIHVRDKAGDIHDCLFSCELINIDAEPCLVSISRDITERKKTEQKLFDYQAKLKSLASQLSLVEERERRRIATELHDQIGQSLVFSKIKLDELQQSTTSSELTEALNEICNHIGQVIQDTRTLTFDLSYPILYELGFEAAVNEWLDEQIGRNHGIKTEFKDDGQSKPLEDDIRALLFRNVRELLINVVKHAKAHNVKVSISKVDSQICVSVEDDGVGIEPAEVTSLAGENTGFGIFSIRERLEQLGGRIDIESGDRGGSKITMTAPLKLTESKK
jgi:PAS domain S-box-containing protein